MEKMNKLLNTKLIPSDKVSLFGAISIIAYAVVNLLTVNTGLFHYFPSFWAIIDTILLIAFGVGIFLYEKMKYIAPAALALYLVTSVFSNLSYIIREIIYTIRGYAYGSEFIYIISSLISLAALLLVWGLPLLMMAAQLFKPSYTEKAKKFWFLPILVQIVVIALGIINGIIIIIAAHASISVAGIRFFSILASVIELLAVYCVCVMLASDSTASPETIIIGTDKAAENKTAAPVSFVQAEKALIKKLKEFYILREKELIDDDDFNLLKEKLNIMGTVRENSTGAALKGAELIREYAELRDKGVITEAEFEYKKNQILK